MNKIQDYYVRFKDWMRYNPPGALTGEGWGQFNREFSEKAPIRWYFHDVFYYKYIYPFKQRYHKIRTWVHYRTKARYHVLKTGKAPGYASVDEQMICACFNLLKNMVEVDYAYKEYWHTDEYKKFNWWQRKTFKWKTLKRPDLGLKHLEWMASLDDPSLPPHQQSLEQAAFARETIALYNWWTVEKDKWEADPTSTKPHWIQTQEYENEHFARLIKIRHHFDD